MSVAKRTYVITALCMIAAGVIYLALPLSKGNLYDEQTRLSEKTVLMENVLYRINQNSIETLYGTYPLDVNTKWISGGKEISSGKARFLGQNIHVVQSEEGTVQKVETVSDLTVPNKIRVVISADLSGNRYIHSKVAISCDEEFWSIKDGEIQTYPPEAEITSDALGKRTIFIPAKEGNTLTLITPNGTKEYLGTLEVTVEQGGYSVVNEVSLENYVKGVVPAEMPASYGEEAAKVQAVCARSYVYSQWSGTEKFACWGAQVDDSVKSQVYGGKIVHSVCENGVEATWGEILTYDDKPISTNYFSTSCGHTANGNEVWGGKEVAYQIGVIQCKEGDFGDLSTEEGFHTFITDYNVQSFDSHSPWFRWSVELSVEQIQKATEIYLRNSPRVKVVVGDSLVEEKISDLGVLSDIFVYERSKTGMALSLLLIGNEKSIVIEKPTEIRKFFGGVSVIMRNGELAGARDLLPSAFIALEKIKDSQDSLVSVVVRGGGYGHGVGMSQNGVKGMVDEGYEYREILNHYFPNTELTIL